MDKRHFIHSRNGRIGADTDTSPADIDAIIDALRTDGRGHLVLHFHGGLVGKAAGTALAERLTTHYQTSAYPVFYVWESGFAEALRNNLAELRHEPVFKNLVRKVLEYALGRLGGTDGARSIAPGMVDSVRVEKAIDAYWADPRPEHVPYRGFEPMLPPAGARAATGVIDEAELQADLEADSALGAALATLPDLAPDGRSALGNRDAVERRTPFASAVAGHVSEDAGGRGVISWFKVALLVKRILTQVLRRYGNRRDHGLYATVVEEVMRGVRLGGSGLNEWGKALQWNRMKQDTLDAFGPDPDVHAGTALLHRLNAALQEGLPLQRITLIGHSTGAIYIAHWLAKAQRMLPPDVRFDVIFLAPAITYELFARTLEEYEGRIGNFRMFCMRDEFERDDQVWGDDGSLENGEDWRRFVYPSSLLYLVSGVLESIEDADGEAADEPDMPLVGMERYFTRTDIYPDAQFPAVARVRKWLQQAPNRLVWSRAEGQPDGLNSGSIDHGGFDNDEATLSSVATVLRGW